MGTDSLTWCALDRSLVMALNDTVLPELFGTTPAGRSIWSSSVSRSTGLSDDMSDSGSGRTVNSVNSELTWLV
jgi:hypothetical protein